MVHALDHAVNRTGQFIGFDKNDDGRLVVNEDEAKLVRRIYKEFMEGFSCGAIASRLNEESIPGMSGEPKWLPVTIRGMLKNEKYMGDSLLQKTYTADFLTRKQVKNEGEITQYYVKDSHPGIIPKEEWTAVQQEFDRIDAYMQAHGLTHFGYGSEMRPFSSKVICRKSGRIYGKKAHSAREKTYWQCITRCYSGVGACDGDNVDEAVIHKVFVEAWNMVIRQQDELNKRWMKQEEEGIELQAFRARQMQELVKQGPITDLIPELVQMVLESIVIKGGYSFDVYFLDTTCINVSFP